MNRTIIMDIANCDIRVHNALKLGEEEVEGQPSWKLDL